MNDKQDVKKVIVKPYFYGENYYCPSCRKHLGDDCDDFKEVNYCSKCGQALEWDGIE